MSARTVIPAVIALAAIVAGTAADVATPSASRVIGGYYALSGDFHVHSFPGAWSSLSPIDTVLEARHRGLDVIAMTPHDSIWAAQLGAWFTRALGGPIVVVGEEITAPRYHLIGVGLRQPIAHDMPLADALAGIHGQNGFAIIAHPYRMDWLADSAPELRALDAAEVVRPESLVEEDAATKLRHFFERGKFTAIGSTDFHGVGPLGFARTWVFARERTPQGVIDALRDGRTVVYDRHRVYGKFEFVVLAANAGLPHEVPAVPLPGLLATLSRVGILTTLAAVVAFNRW